jgi:predicted nucleic-acid-binding protein
VIGLDTNVLARYVLDDDPYWSPRVAQFVDHKLSPERPGFINVVTLVELVWILRRKPGYDRARLADIIGGLLSSNRIVLGNADVIERALSAFRSGGARFADYLIAELNQVAGASHTVTLDTAAAKNLPFIPFSQEA